MTNDPRGYVPVAVELPLCGCGCGGRVKTRFSTFLRGHWNHVGARSVEAHRPQERACMQCGTLFTPTMNYKGKVFCQRACYWAHQRSFKAPPSGDPCKQCGKQFERPRRNPYKAFCSKKCLGQSLIRVPFKTCPHCGKLADKPEYMGFRRSGRKFCDRSCHDAHRRAKAGSERKFVAGRKKIKGQYLMKRPQACQICGYDRYVEWAHIIPRKQGGTAASVNIAILCPNHHRLFDHGRLSPAEQEVMERLLEVARNDPRACLKVISCSSE